MKYYNIPLDTYTDGETTIYLALVYKAVNCAADLLTDKKLDEDAEVYRVDDISSLIEYIVTEYPDGNDHNVTPIILDEDGNEIGDIDDPEEIYDRAYRVSEHNRLMSCVVTDPPTEGLKGSEEYLGKVFLECEKDLKYLYDWHGWYPAVDNGFFIGYFSEDDVKSFEDHGVLLVSGYDEWWVLV